MPSPIFASWSTTRQYWTRVISCRGQLRVLTLCLSFAPLTERKAVRAQKAYRALFWRWPFSAKNSRPCSTPRAGRLTSRGSQDLRTDGKGVSSGRARTGLAITASC